MRKKADFPEHSDDDSLSFLICGEHPLALLTRIMHLSSQNYAAWVVALGVLLYLGLLGATLCPGKQV